MHIYTGGFEVCLLVTEFDCSEVTSATNKTLKSSYVVNLFGSTSS